MRGFPRSSGRDNSRWRIFLVLWTRKIEEPPSSSKNSHPLPLSSSVRSSTYSSEPNIEDGDSSIFVVEDPRLKMEVSSIFGSENRKCEVLKIQILENENGEAVLDLRIRRSNIEEGGCPLFSAPKIKNGSFSKKYNFIQE